MAYSSHHSSRSKVSLADVSDKTYATIVEMIESTFDPSMVGRGHDANNLDHFGIRINDIQEVKNGKLLREYRDFRDELREKTSDGDNVEEITKLPKKVWQFKKESRQVDLNEIYLFHGTSEDAANSIIHKGFKIRAINPKNLYGRGIYFSEKITKADQYSDAKKFKQPPCMLCGEEDCPHGWENRYDSVLGSGGMIFREFVVYDERQCYPEFLINYERIGGWEPIEMYE